MTDLPITAPEGASVWERRLFLHLTEHVENERNLLAAYEAAADASGSKAMVYLVNLLVEDEKRHHRLFVELTASLKSDVELEPADPVVPRMDFAKADPAAILDLSGRLLESEKKDKEELKQLRRELRDVEDTTLWGLLVELMQRDTDKHIAILNFARRHAKRKRL